LTFYQKVVITVGGSGRTVIKRLFGLHSLAIPFELYLNASQGANPAYAAALKLLIATATLATLTDPSTEIAAFRWFGWYRLWRIAAQLVDLWV